MIYANVSGRLGNQLFYYAVARKLQLRSGKRQEICFNFESVYNHNENEELGFEDSLKYFNTVPYTVINEPMGHVLKEKSAHWQYKLAIKVLNVQNQLQKCMLRKPVAFFLRGLDHCCNRLAGLYFYPHRLNEKYTKVKLRTALSKRSNWFVMGRYENAEWFNDIRPVLIRDLTPRFHE